MIMSTKYRSRSENMTYNLERVITLLFPREALAGLESGLVSIDAFLNYMTVVHRLLLTLTL